MFTNIPLVYFHKGDNDYLRISLKQAAKYNNTIILLGDKSNSSFTSNWFDINDLSSERFNYFSSHYKNYSLNDPVFELRCFERYFYIYEFCKLNGIDKFILCDSDLLIYDNLSVYFKDAELAFSQTISKPDTSKALSPHCSLWNFEKLESFVNFLIETYENDLDLLKDMFDEYVLTHKKGGICDMTLLYLWVNKNNFDFFNTAVQVDKKYIVDHAMSLSHNGEKNEYRKSFLTGCKIVKFNLGKPAFIKKSGCPVKVIALHCSGGYKAYMKLLSKNTGCQILLFFLRIKFKLVELVK